MTDMIFVALPAFAGVNCVGLTHSLLRLQAVLHTKQMAIELFTVANCANQPAARGYPMTLFLDRSKAEYYLSLDADVEFEPAQIMRLVNSGHELAAATYGTKSQRSRPIGNYLSPEPERADGWVEMRDLGLGCVLIRREGLDRLVAKFPERINHDGMPMVPWFIPRIEDDQYLSCDGAFFWHWRQAGGRVWVDEQSAMKHWGTHVYPPVRPPAARLSSDSNRGKSK